MAKSSRQKAAELKVRKTARLTKRAQRSQHDRLAFKAATGIPSDGTPCNLALLNHDGSYSTPKFVERGYYRDEPFQCRDCGVSEVWTATQQKWWYEIAKGGVSTRATRCRPCRRKARDAARLQREKSEIGRERKVRLKAAGKWRTGF